jgi:20S proteasome alpha/beta subunit
VTLIVGIICKDGIVVAGDSQTTWGTGKSWSANKMTELDHVYGRALVAESGALVTSARGVEHLVKNASNRELMDTLAIPGLAAKAIRNVREELRQQQFDCSAEELQDFIFREELDCELMIAHYDNGPAIDTIRLTVGIPKRAKSFFETTGSGADLADYLLTDMCNPDMDCKTASVIAVHVIEIAKRHDPYCGGPTKLGVLPLPTAHSDLVNPPSLMPASVFDSIRHYYKPAIILSQSETDEIVKMVSEVEKQTTKKRSEIIRDELKRRSRRRLKQMMRDIDAPSKAVDIMRQSLHEK